MYILKSRSLIIFHHSIFFISIYYFAAVDISPSCNLKLDDKKPMEYGNKIATQLTNFIINSKQLDLKGLVIINKKFCWSVCIDLLILQMDGDPLDACSIATYIG